jgi:hypothetical protein
MLADAAGAERRTSEPSTEAALCLARARIPLFLFIGLDPNTIVCVRVNHKQAIKVDNTAMSNRHFVRSA